MDVDIIIRLLLTAVAVLVIALIIPGIKVKGFIAALLASIGIALINFFVKPLLVGLIPNVTPIITITLVFIINAILIMIVSLVIPGFKVRNFWSALLFSLVFALFEYLFSNYLLDLA